MNELTQLLTKIELAADNVIDTKQQIIDLDAKRHKARESINCLKELKTNKPGAAKKNWLCIGDMFIRLGFNDTRNLIIDEHYHLEQGIEKLRNKLSEKVNELRVLEGKPELTSFNLKSLSKQEILALRTGFKL